MMDEATFQALARRAKLLNSDYGAGYLRGLRRARHGNAFGTAEEHAIWSRLGLDGDNRAELGRGYRDGLAGAEPDPRIGRPALPDGAGKTARVELRITPATKAAWQAKAEASGMTLQAWIESRCGGKR